MKLSNLIQKVKDLINYWEYDVRQPIVPLFENSNMVIGFEKSGSANTDSTISATGRVFTLGANSSYNVRCRGIKTNIIANKTVTVDDATQQNYIYLDEDMVLTASSTPWLFSDKKIFVGTMYYNTTLADSLVCEERHGVNSPRAIHGYLHDTVGCRYESGLTGTFNDDGTFTITAGIIHDEDIQINIAEQTTGRVLWREAAGTWHFEDTSTIDYQVGGVIQYDDGDGTPADVDNGQYVSYYVYGTPDINDPIWIIMGQRTDTTIANAEANQTPGSLTLGTLPSPEMKILYQIIYKRAGTNETVEATLDYRQTSSIGGTVASGTSHLALSDLTTGDSGHTQFIRSDVADISIGQIDFQGDIKTDIILESTSDAGVTIEGILIKDSAIKLQDDEKIEFGTGTDFEIYHDATNTIHRNLLSDSDTIFYVNDGGVDTEIMRFDGDTSLVKFPTAINIDTINEYTADAGVTITQQAFIEPALDNDWVSYNATTHNAFGYMKDSMGFVHLQGTIKDGTTLSVVTLPAGYRPNKTEPFIIVSNAAMAYCNITPDGLIALYGYNNTWVSLEGITFKAV